MQYILESFTLGIVYGLGPCTVSCAPVMVPLIVSTSNSYKQGLLYALMFGAGRVLVYTVLGALFGFLGQQLDFSIPGWAMGAFIIAMGVAVLFRVQNKCFAKRVKITGLHMSFIAGIIMGLSPCAPMLSALAIAIASQSAMTGLFIGLVFGIGTIISPTIVLGLISGWWGGLKEFRGINTNVAGAFMIILGLLYLLA